MHGHHRPRPAPLSARSADLEVRAADPRVRIGDAERDLVIDQLADHHAAGRLTLPEFEDRMAAASTARTGADLAVLTADLPAPPSPPTPRSPARPAARRLQLDPAVRTYLAVMVLLWLIWLVTGAGYPWPVWPMLGWGIGVAGKYRRNPARPAP
jgi:Domain of unknown function (DUF1707)/2TM domain